MIADGPREQAKRSGAAIGEFIREQRQQGQVSLRQLARLAGVSNPYLSQIERGLRKPSAEILQQIAKGLRISAEQLYVRAGILEYREGNQELVAAILGDEELGERQKQVLLDIYESFRRENAQRRAEAAVTDASSAASQVITNYLTVVAAHSSTLPMTMGFSNGLKPSLGLPALQL